MYDKDPRQLLDVKMHQLWMYDEQYQAWYPMMHQQFSNEDYDRALRSASYYTQRGRTVRLVTSVITFAM